MNNEIIKFVNGDLQLDVTVSPDKETVWLSANQMAILFDRDEKTIRKHINNTFKDQEVEKENNTQKMRVVGVKQSVPFYSLDVIISVGYRVKSQNGIIFRKWATSILKDYMIKGYAVNQKRLDVLNKTIAIIIDETDCKFEKIKKKIINKKINEIEEYKKQREEEKKDLEQNQLNDYENYKTNYNEHIKEKYRMYGNKSILDKDKYLIKTKWVGDFI